MFCLLKYLNLLLDFILFDVKNIKMFKITVDKYPVGVYIVYEKQNTPWGYSEAEVNMDCRLQDELSRQIEKKLNRIQGQVNGISKMVLENRNCDDILTQISAVRCALDGVAKDVLFNHIGHCVKEGLESGEYDKTVENLVGTVGKYIKSK